MFAALKLVNQLYEINEMFKKHNANKFMKDYRWILWLLIEKDKRDRFNEWNHLRNALNDKFSLLLNFRWNNKPSIYLRIPQRQDIVL